MKLTQKRAEAGNRGGLEGDPQKLKSWRLGVSGGDSEQVGLSGKTLQEAVGPLYC